MWRVGVRYVFARLFAADPHVTVRVQTDLPATREVREHDAGPRLLHYWRGDARGKQPFPEACL